MATLYAQPCGRTSACSRRREGYALGEHHAAQLKRSVGRKGDEVSAKHPGALDGQLTSSARLHRVLIAAMWIPLVAALYFIFPFGG
jgi:hypothetical protein